MPRIGRHPLKKTSVDLGRAPRLLSVSTLVHIPEVSGFWASSLEVLRVSLASLVETTRALDAEVIVFDNASCPEVRSYLHAELDRGGIDILIHSRKNVGKLDALNQIFAVARGEFIAYTDSDVLLLPGWIEESLRVLEAFPEAARVTALPLAGGNAAELSSSAFGDASKAPGTSIETGILIPPEYIEAHRRSIGLDEAAYAARLAGRQDVRLGREGVFAFLSGADFQFTIRASAARAVLPLETDPEVDTVDAIYTPVLERKLVERGDWLLCTTGYFAHHLGNNLPDLADELPWLEPRAVTYKPSSSHQTRTPLVRSPRIRRLLKWVHLRTYDLLYGRAD